MTSTRLPRPATAWISVVVTAVLVATGLSLGVATTASADEPVTGTIAGTITVPGSPDPVLVGEDDVLVTAWLYQYDIDAGVPYASYAAETTTDASGAWSFVGLPVGEYVFEYSYRGALPNIISELSNGSYSVDEAVAAGSWDYLPADADATYPAALQLGGIVSGTVRAAATSAALVGQPVSLWRYTSLGGGTWVPVADREGGTTGTSAAGGLYSFVGLPSGTYTMQTGGANGYVAEFWTDRYVADPTDADTFSVTAGSTTTANVSLVTGSKITGTVKSTTNAALAGIEVTVQTWDYWTGTTDVASTTTAANGTYTFGALLPGDYIVRFASPSGAAVKYLSEYWNDAPRPESATTIVLGPGAIRGAVNATLARAATITGTVSLAGGSGDLSFEVSACRQQYPSSFYVDCTYGTASTQPGGQYSITDLPAGTYTVKVDYTGTGNFRDEYLGNARESNYGAVPDATFFTLAAGATATGKNVELDPGAQISGTVRVNGTPTAGVTVEVYSLSTGTTYPDLTTTTQDGGTYSIVGLDFESYEVRALPSSDAVSPQWYSGAPTRPQATSLTFSDATAATGVDFALEASATINGTILGHDPLGGPDLPMDTFHVIASRYLNGASDRVEFVSDTWTDSSGAFSLRGLPAGDYLVKVAPPWEVKSYLEQYLGGEPGESAATVARITVAAGGSVTVNDVLTRGASYTGRVVNALGEPLSAVSVEAREIDGEGYASGMTDENGYYTITGLLPVAHRLTFNTYELDNLGPNYTDRAITASAGAVDAAAVTLPDTVLQLSATLSGVVIGINGRVPAYPVSIFAHVRSDDGWWDYVETVNPNASGGFTMDDLPAGVTMYLAFRTYDNKLTDRSPYPFQYLGGSPIRELSTPIIITTPGSSTFREARLVTGGALTGVITNKATGRGIAGIDIEANAVQGYGGGVAITNAAGAYVLPGLDAGGYSVSFNSRSSGSSTVGVAYGSVSRTVYVPDRTTVTSSAALTPAMKVSGTVRTASGPLKDATVTAYAYSGGVVDYDDPYLTDSTAVTDAAGNYALYLLPGTYVLRFDDPAKRVASAWLGGASDVALSTPVVVVKTALAGRNITLATTTGAIDGTVRDLSGSNPWGSVEVFRSDGSPMFRPEGYRPEGRLDLALPVTNLPAGTYRVVITRASRCYDINCDAKTPESSKVFEDVVVGSGTTLLNNGDPIVFTEPDLTGAVPDVVPGDEPTLSSTTPQVGDTVTIDPGVWAPVPSRFEYEWYRNGRPIAGATSDEYTVAPGDAGKVISASVWGFSDDSFGNRVLIAGTAPVLPGDAANPLTAPTVGGLAVAGQTVQAKAGTWDLPNLTFSYQWVRSTSSGPDVVVSTAPTYKLVLADVNTAATNARLTLRVTASRVGFKPATISVPVEPVAPAIALKQTVKSVVSSVAGGYKVTSGTWTPTGAAITYEWRQYAPDGSFVSFDGGSGASSTLTDAGAVASTDRLVALVTATKAGYTTTTVLVQARAGAAVTLPTPPVLSSVTPQVGYTVSVDTSAAVTLPAGATWTYQWLRDGAVIAGATKSAYSPVTADVAKSLSVRLVATVTGYAPSAPLVLTSGTVLPPGSFTVGTATVTGTPAVGRVLAVDLGVWAPQPATVSYKWTRNGVAIPGAVRATYALTTTDLGKTIAVVITGARPGYTSATTTATAATITTLAPQNSVAPSIGARGVVGARLTAAVGTWDVAPTGYTYQWFQNDVPIAGAVAATYVPTVDDLDNEVRVEVTAVKAGYPVGAPVSSNALTIEPGAAIQASALPVLTVDAKAAKTARLGKTVIATAGTWPVVSLSLTYQWQVNRNDGAGYVDLVGATSKQLVLDATVPADFAAGYTYRVVVSATRTGYLTGPSAVSAPLTALP